MPAVFKLMTGKSSCHQSLPNLVSGTGHAYITIVLIQILIFKASPFLSQFPLVKAYVQIEKYFYFLGINSTGLKYLFEN